MFASDGPVWLDPTPLPADADLSAFSKDDLVRIYNLEMDWRRAGGTPHAEAPHLTSSWDARPKAALVAKLEELRSDGTTKRLFAPHRLNAHSVPTLVRGTLLRTSGGYRTSAEYAIVDGETAGGRVKLRILACEQIEFVPAAAAGAASTTRYRCVLRGPARRFAGNDAATFDPCPRPTDLNARIDEMQNAHWTLRTGRNHMAYAKFWERVNLAELAVDADGAIEWTEHASAHD